MKKISVILFSLMLIVAISSQSCKKSFVWDPTGLWTVTFNFTAYSYVFNEQMTFANSESGGSVSGFTFDGAAPPQTGTWTKTGDFSLTVIISFNTWGEDVNINMTMSSSEASPNAMNGSGIDHEDADTYNFISNATKISNLQ